jgi:hypothetical protein
MFLEVHDLNSKLPIFVNSDHLLWIETRGEGCALFLQADKGLRVVETAETVASAILRGSKDGKSRASKSASSSA